MAPRRTRARGYPYPPEVMAARVVRPERSEHLLDDQVVEVGYYYPDSGLFECEVFGELWYFYARELLPLSEGTRQYFESCTRTEEYKLYDAEVYDLRDELEDFGIYVKAEGISKWTPRQLSAVRKYVAVLDRAEKNGLRWPDGVPDVLGGRG